MSKQQRIETLERNVFGPTGLVALCARLTKRVEALENASAKAQRRVEPVTVDMGEERHEWGVIGSTADEIPPMRRCRPMPVEEELDALRDRVKELEAEVEQRDWERARLQSYDISPEEANRLATRVEQQRRTIWMIEEERDRLRVEVKNEKAWRQRARSAESERDHLQTEVDRLTAEAKERERHIEELEARFAKARQFFTPGRERDAA